MSVVDILVEDVLHSSLNDDPLDRYSHIACCVAGKSLLEFDQLPR